MKSNTQKLGNVRKQSTRATVEQPKTRTKDQKPSYIPEEEVNVPPGEGLFPSIGIVQSLSPEKDPNDARFIDGVQEGMLFHSITRELFDGGVGIVVIPLMVVKNWAEYIPRKQGGGLVQVYNTVEEAKQMSTPGNDVQVTINYYVMLEDDESMAVIRLGTPTKMKTHRKWATLIQDAKSISGRRYKLSVVREKNRAQQAYYNFSVESVGWASKQLYDHAQSLIEDIKRGVLALPGSSSNQSTEM